MIAFFRYFRSCKANTNDVYPLLNKQLYWYDNNKSSWFYIILRAISRKKKMSNLLSTKFPTSYYSFKKWSKQKDDNSIKSLNQSSNQKGIRMPNIEKEIRLLDNPTNSTQNHINKSNRMWRNKSAAKTVNHNTSWRNTEQYDFFMISFFLFNILISFVEALLFVQIRCNLFIWIHVEFAGSPGNVNFFFFLLDILIFI